MKKLENGDKFMLDNHGREINYLRVSLTDRCNLRCIYCMPEQGAEKKKHEDILRFDEIIKVVKTSAVLGIKKVRFTGGEPLIIPEVDRLIYDTSRIKNIEDVSLTTNGILLSEAAEDLKKAGLKRVNISLDTLNTRKYKSITRGGEINKVIEAIDKSISIGLSPVKINTVIIKGINDDEVKDFIRLTKELPVEVRFIQLMPIGEGTKLYEKGKMGFDEIIENYPDLIPLSNDKGSTAKLYKLKNSKGRLGFISPLSCKFCSSCNKIRLTSEGAIRSCLYSEEEINVKGYINNEVRLNAALRSAIMNKPMQHYFDEENNRAGKMMFQIGG